MHTHTPLEYVSTAASLCGHDCTVKYSSQWPKFQLPLTTTVTATIGTITTTTPDCAVVEKKKNEISARMRFPFVVATDRSERQQSRTNTEQKAPCGCKGAKTARVQPPSRAASNTSNKIFWFGRNHTQIHIVLGSMTGAPARSHGNRGHTRTTKGLPSHKGKSKNNTTSLFSWRHEKQSWVAPEMI